ncbi:MAG: VOC family protein [Gemmatimonadaceae bacterium]
MSTSVAPKAIGQIAVNVYDVPRAVAFYRDVLELPLLFEVPPKMAFFMCGTVRLMLSIADSPQFDHPGSILYYKVDDIQATHRAMVAKGVVFGAGPHLIAKMPDHELWLADFKDTEGNLAALMAEIR